MYPKSCCQTHLPCLKVWPRYTSHQWSPLALSSKSHHIQTFDSGHTTEECQIVGKQFSMGEELCRLDDVGMRMHFIPYRKTFSHNLALLRPLTNPSLTLLHYISLNLFTCTRQLELCVLHPIKDSSKFHVLALHLVTKASMPLLLSSGTIFPTASAIQAHLLLLNAHSKLICSIINCVFLVLLCKALWYISCKSAI